MQRNERTEKGNLLKDKKTIELSMVKQNSQGFRTALFFFHIPMLNFHNSEAELSQGT